MSDHHPNRREFLQAGLAAGASLALADALFAAQQDDGRGLPTRPLGKTGANVSILCLGGWHIGKAGKDSGDAAAIKLMQAALDAGMTFFDNAWDYHDGYSEELMGKAIHDRRDRVFLMTKNCERDYEGSLSNLEDSLRRLKTDRIDLWQFHEMVYDNDPDWVFEKGGMKAALEAQKAGKVRFIGFTGHKDPRIHLKMLGKPYEWASSQMPINVCDWHFRSFANEVVPVCLEKGVGVLGMKSLGGSPDGTNGRLPQAGLVSATDCMRYALSQPVSTLVVGLRNERDLEQALAVGRDFKPMSADEQHALRRKVAEVAGDGRHELFKSTKLFDGPHHRKQHGFAVDT
ncbi:MAG TPA: aldo/keto reductase [Planctomycetaceae bacterium]|nr:aldo/keto reductase [Planctomycetaceae bacterium]